MPSIRSPRRSTAQRGDSSLLERYRLSEVFSRTLFFIELPDATGRHDYAVDIRYFADEIEDGDELASGARAPASLYRDGVQILRSDVPSVFPAPGGVIEVATSMYGLRRMHYVPDEGPERPLQPDAHAPEGLRARFALRFPRASRALGWAATVVLLVGLIAAVPQSLETISRLDLIADQVGVFVSPFRLPVWLNGALAVATVGAGVERALTLRSHRLIDAELHLDGAE